MPGGSTRSPLPRQQVTLNSSGSSELRRIAQSIFQSSFRSSGLLESSSIKVWLQCVGCCTSTPASSISRDMPWLRRDGWGRCTPAPGCSGCCWGWRWLGSWRTSCCPTPPHGRQRWRGPASCSAPGERGRSPPKTTAHPPRSGGTRVAWSVTEYLPSSLLTFEGRWMLALLCLRSSALQR